MGPSEFWSLLRVEERQQTALLVDDLITKRPTDLRKQKSPGRSGLSLDVIEFAAPTIEKAGGVKVYARLIQ